jgi:ABC-type amino acid transport system permease subunit
VWYKLSEAHRDEYTIGFADTWKGYVSSDAVQVLAAEWRFVGRVVLPSLVLVGLSVVVVHNSYRSSSGLALPKFVVEEALGAIGAWLLMCVGAGHFDSRLAHSRHFRTFRKVATFVLAAIVVATGVNVLSNWLAK